MTQTFNGRKKVRKYFGSIRDVAAMPNLIEVQKASYDQFLQVNEMPGGGRIVEGLEAVFQSVFQFPILQALPCWNLFLRIRSPQI